MRTRGTSNGIDNVRYHNDITKVVVDSRIESGPEVAAMVAIVAVYVMTSMTGIKVKTTSMSTRWLTCLHIVEILIEENAHFNFIHVQNVLR